MDWFNYIDAPLAVITMAWIMKYFMGDLTRELQKTRKTIYAMSRIMLWREQRSAKGDDEKAEIIKYMRELEQLNGLKDKV